MLGSTESELDRPDPNTGLELVCEQKKCPSSRQVSVKNWLCFSFGGSGGPSKQSSHRDEAYEGLKRWRRIESDVLKFFVDEVEASKFPRVASRDVCEKLIGSAGARPAVADSRNSDESRMCKHGQERNDNWDIVRSSSDRMCSECLVVMDLLRDHVVRLRNVAAIVDRASCSIAQQNTDAGNI